MSAQPAPVVVPEDYRDDPAICRLVADVNNQLDALWTALALAESRIVALGG